MSHSYVMLLVVAEFISALSAQTLTTLANFGGANGDDPEGAALVQGLDGNLYGTTAYGGTCTLTYLGCGLVFKITPSGGLTTLHLFAGPDGAFPYSGLVLATDGNYYGTTQGGGANCVSSNGCGTVFRMAPTGKLTTLYSFCSQANCADGNGPSSPLIQAADGELYGTTYYGGTSSNCFQGCGAVFKITLGGALTTLSSFAGGSNGFYPSGNMVQGIDRDLFGTTSLGGLSGSGTGIGTVFRMGANAKVQTMYSFCVPPDCSNGGFPTGGLIQATDGVFYGTTQTGGNTLACNGGCGTTFKITAQGVLQTLHSFAATDGFTPAGGLIQATDGNFYGTTVEGGYNYLCPGGCGTIFKMDAGGTVTTIYNLTTFKGPADPRAALLEATDGNFYGTSATGGYYGSGTVFRLSTGLGPFVRALPYYGRPGDTITLLGNNLTGTSGVSFNGAPAVFTVVSGTEISTTIPTGATTGKINVVLPGGTLFSGGPFIILP